jgi:hypothetical protein
MMGGTVYFAKVALFEHRPFHLAFSFKILHVARSPASEQYNSEFLRTR